MGDAGELAIILRLQNEAAATLAESRAQFAAYFKDTQAGAQETKTAVSGIGSGINANTAGMGEFQDSLRNVKSLALGVGAAILAWKAYAGVKDLMEWGVKYNATIETAKLGIASLIATNEDLISQDGRKLQGIEKLQAAQKIAADLTKQLQIDNLQTIATMPQLIAAFQQAVGPGLAIGMTLQDVEHTVIRITKAAGAMGIDMERLPQEIRSILQGTITPRMSRVAEGVLGPYLGVSSKELPEAVRQLAKAGKLAETLKKALDFFEVAGPKVQQTWLGVVSNMKDVVGIVMGGGTQDFIESLKKELTDLMAEVMTYKKDAAGNITDIKINPDVLAKVKELGADLQTVVGIIKDIGGFLYNNYTLLKDIAIAAAAAWAVSKVVALIAAVQELIGAVTTLWARYLAGETAANGASDALALGLGKIGSLAAVAGAAFAGWNIGKLLDQVNVAGKTIGEWVQRGYNQLGMHGFFGGKPGGENDFGGMNVDAFKSEHQNEGDYTVSNPNDLTPEQWAVLGNKSIHPVTEVNNNASAVKGPDKKTLDAARQLADQMARINDELAKSSADSARSDAETTVKALDAAYREGLLSADDYYKAKEQMQGQELDAEQAALDKDVSAAWDAYQQKLAIGGMTAKDKKLAAAEWAKAEQEYYDKSNELDNKRTQEAIANDEAIAAAHKKTAEEITRDQQKIADLQDRINKSISGWKANVAQLQIEYVKLTGTDKERLEAEATGIDDELSKKLDAITKEKDAAMKAANDEIAAITQLSKDRTVPPFVDPELVDAQTQQKIDAVNKIKDAIIAGANDETAAVKKLADAQKADITAQSQDDIQGFIQGWAKAFKDYSDALTNYQIARAAGQQFISNMTSDNATLIDNLINGANGWTALKDWWKTLMDDIVKTWSDGLAKMVSTWISQFMDQIAGTASSGGSWWESVLSDIGNLLGTGSTGTISLSSAESSGSWGTYMATGGIVTKPTRAIIGEAGPEAVIPLGKLGSAGSGNKVQVSINVMAMDGPSFKAYLAAEGKDVIKNIVADAVSTSGSYSRIIRGGR
jgi:hypothetical protein